MRLNLAAVTLCCCTGLFAQRAASTRFVYAVSGKPAAGMTVETMGAQPGRYTTDGSGRIPVALGVGRVHVTDPQSGLMLLDTGIVSPSAELAIAIPIRLSGEVAGFGGDPERVQIDVGYGERMALSDYQRVHQKLQLVRRPDEDTVHNLPIPPVHGQSVRLHPDVSGHFTTGWIAAVDAPQVLVFGGAEARTAAKTVALSKSIKPRSTVRVGKISPAFGATLEIHVNAPKTDLPLGLLVGVASLDPGGSSRQQTAELLSVLHRRDSAVSLFLVRRREIPLSFDDVTRIEGLPPIESLKLYFGGPITGVRVERTVRIPAQGVVRVDLSEEELLGQRSPRTTFSGVLRFEGEGTPVANAKVVYSSYPDKKEAQTGPDGRFQFPGVVNGRPATLFIDMPNPNGRPPFDRVTVSKPVPASAAAPAAAAAEQVFELPRPVTGGFLIQRPPQGGTTNLAASPPNLVLDVSQQQPVIQYQFPGCTAGFTQDDLQLGSQPIMTAYQIVNEKLVGPVLIDGTGEGQVNGQAVYKAQFPAPGSYEVFLEYTPFVFSAVQAEVTQPAGTIFFSSPTNIPTLQIQLLGTNKSPVPADVEVSFPTYSPELDPLEVLTDSNGVVTINCLTYSNLEELRSLPIYVNDATSGYFEGDLALTGPKLQIQLVTPPEASAAVRRVRK